jgi:hypothetical protein
VAELRGVSIDDARSALESSGAQLQAVAGDGYWSQ